MKAVFINRYGNADVMQYEEQPQPSAGPGEILQAMKTASINPIDYKVREGKAKELLALQNAAHYGQRRQRDCGSCG